MVGIKGKQIINDIQQVLLIRIQDYSQGYFLDVERKSYPIVLGVLPLLFHLYFILIKNVYFLTRKIVSGLVCGLFIPDSRIVHQTTRNVYVVCYGDENESKVTSLLVSVIFTFNV